MMDHHSGGKLPELCGDGNTSMDTANPCLCGGCVVQRELRCQDGIRAAELQTYREPEHLKSFLWDQGREGWRELGGTTEASIHSVASDPVTCPHNAIPFMERPSCSLPLLSFRHISRLFAV